MKKRKFGMASLLISQGRYGNYSHAKFNAYDLAGADGAIDKFTTFNDLEVIGIYPYSTTGFANTVHFYDKENDVTIAMTHMNYIKSDCTIGHVYHRGEVVYYEGTTGKATGNHIHMEISKGRNPSKIKKDYGWALNPEGWVNIEDYFYIDPNFTTVKNAAGYKFEEKEEIVAGYKRTLYYGQIIHLYEQGEDLRLGVISAGKNDHDRLTIDKIDDARTHYCKVNAGYFNMQNGEHYGVEISPTMELVPHNDYYLAVYEKDGKIEWAPSDQFWFNGQEVSWAMSPFAVLYHEGPVKALSKAYGNKMGIANTQTFLIGLTDNRAVLGVCEGKLTPEQILDFAKVQYNIKLRHLSLYDSGGSSQMIANGEKKFFTSRAIANCFTLYKEEKEDDTMIYFKVAKGTYTKNGKRAIPTRKAPGENYDLNFPVYVGERFGVTGKPANVGGVPCYKIGEGPQEGRYMKFDPQDLKDGYFTMVV